MFLLIPVHIYKYSTFQKDLRECNIKRIYMKVNLANF
jgi:hypothetical protein